MITQAGQNSDFAKKQPSHGKTEATSTVTSNHLCDMKSNITLNTLVSQRFG